MYRRDTTHEKFFKLFEERIARCDPGCRHYYVEHVYKDNTLHYKLNCTVHNHRIVVPRVFATEDILNGAVVVDFYDGELTNSEFEELAKEAYRLKKMASRTS